MWWQLLNRGYIWWLTGDEVVTKREGDFFPDSVSLFIFSPTRPCAITVIVSCLNVPYYCEQIKFMWRPLKAKINIIIIRCSGQGKKMWWPRGEYVVAKGRKCGGQGKM